MGCRRTHVYVVSSREDIKFDSDPPPNIFGCSHLEFNLDILVLKSENIVFAHVANRSCQLLKHGIDGNRKVDGIARNFVIVREGHVDILSPRARCGTKIDRYNTAR